jgi:hypothetical protein
VTSFVDLTSDFAHGTTVVQGADGLSPATLEDIPDADDAEDEPQNGDDSPASGCTDSGAGGGNNDGNGDNGCESEDASECIGACACVHLRNVNPITGTIGPEIESHHLAMSQLCIAVRFRVIDVEDVWGCYPKQFKHGMSLGDLDNSKRRSVLYHYYAKQIYGVTGRHNRCRLADCVVWAVRKKYPESDGEYVGHKWVKNGSLSSTSGTSTSGSSDYDSDLVEIAYDSDQAEL